MGRPITADTVGDLWISTIELSGVRDLDGLMEAFAVLLPAEALEEFPGLQAPAATENKYETMVFRLDENGEVSDWTELACRRYQTEEDALKGHAAMVEMCKQK